MVRQIRTFGDLASEPAHEIGEQVFVEEDGESYTSVGTTNIEILRRLSYESIGIWLPDHARHSIQQRHLVRFLAGAESMRQAGLLVSRSARQVDLLVELRQVHGEILVRAFHLSPTKRGPEGRQIWP